MKIIDVVVHMIKLEYLITTIIGRIRAISTSKIRKIIVIKKNRREKGSREEVFGSNPHSNGEHFSRSIRDFLERIEANTITAVVIRISTKAIRITV